MFSGLTLVTPPVSDPVTLADAKAHSRILINLDDALISGYIASATIILEDYCKRAFMPQTWRLALQHFPGRKPGLGYAEATTPEEYYRWNHIKIPKPPLVAIQTFTYADTLGNVFNMTQGFGSQVGNYLLDLEPEPGRIVLPFSGIWPTTILLPASPILITYDCGFPAYSGQLEVGATGTATWISGDLFDKRLRGTWINIGGQSVAVSQYINTQTIKVTGFSGTLNQSLDYSANSVPMPIRNAILLLAAHRYELREPIAVARGEVAIEIPWMIETALANWRI